MMMSFLASLPPSSTTPDTLPSTLPPTTLPTSTTLSGFEAELLERAYNIHLTAQALTALLVALTIAWVAVLAARR